MEYIVNYSKNLHPYWNHKPSSTHSSQKESEQVVGEPSASLNNSYMTCGRMFSCAEVINLSRRSIMGWRGARTGSFYRHRPDLEILSSSIEVLIKERRILFLGYDPKHQRQHSRKIQRKRILGHILRRVPFAFTEKKESQETYKSWRQKFSNIDTAWLTVWCI